MLSTETIIIISLIVLTLCIIASFFLPDKLKRMKKYTDIYIGMSESDMLEIIGGVHYADTYYSGLKKLDIYVKDGLVEEIRPYNI